MRSWNWPCTSPQMVTGARTGCTLDSSMRISRALSHSCFTSPSVSGVQSISRVMKTSSVSMPMSAILNRAAAA